MTDNTSPLRQVIDEELRSVEAKIDALRAEVRDLQQRDTELQNELANTRTRCHWTATRILDVERHQKSLQRIAEVPVTLDRAAYDLVRREQALRARLAKTDVSPVARLGILREGAESGILNDDQRLEWQAREQELAAEGARKSAAAKRQLELERQTAAATSRKRKGKR